MRYAAASRKDNRVAGLMERRLRWGICSDWEVCVDLQGRVEMCLFSGGGEKRREEMDGWLVGCVRQGKVSVESKTWDWFGERRERN